jgi:hypothetical protein
VRWLCSKGIEVAQEIAIAGVEAITQVLRAQTPAHYGRPTATKLVELARCTGSSGRALSGRSTSLRILCDQLEHTQANLARLEAEVEQLLTTDPEFKGLQQIPEFGRHFGSRVARRVGGCTALRACG